EPAQAPPLVLRAGDELVDDDLGDVDEVAELRLPQDEPLRAIEAVAVLEAEDADLGERAVPDLDRRLARVEVLKRPVSLAGLVIVQDGVPLPEGAALGVLPAQAHGSSIEAERRERQELGGSPVELLL